MIKGKTKTGFSYTIDEKQLQNYEFLELVAEAEENNLVLPKILKLLLGDQVEALKNHVRDKNDFISLDKILEEVTDILKNTPKLKNS